MKFWDYIKKQFYKCSQSIVAKSNEANSRKDDDDSVCKDFVLKECFPFSVSENDVIYIEPFYDVERNSYICEHYDEICNKCESVGCRFIYLPKQMPLLLADSKLLKYNLPGCDAIDSIDMDAAIGQIYNLYCEFIQTQVDIDLSQPIFLHTRCEYNWLYCKASSDITCLLNDIFRPNFFGSRVRLRVSSQGDHIRYELCGELDDDMKADWNFSYEIENLKEEIVVRINKLRTYGVEDAIIKELFDYKPRLSRLTITSDYRILLPDYDIEIKLTPLNKAVYLLFLRHEEGILFKNLVDYRNELLSIYGRITRFEDSERIERSIDLLVDSTNNSINEKCSRIREAFVSQFSDEIAQYYYITGDRLSPKHIELDRSLVVWECEL